MFDKIKNFFSRKGAGGKAHKPRDIPRKGGAGARAGKASAGTQAAASVPSVDLKASSQGQTHRHVRELRLALARSRAQLAGGDTGQIKQVRAMRQQLAQAQSHIQRSHRRTQRP